MAGVYEDASELEKLIHECDFENQQYVKLIEKENQHSEALEREISDKKAQTERLQAEITQMDIDTKQYHKQFTINRDNCESLKKTSQVLTEHIAAMNKKLELSTLKRKQDREEHELLVKHYRNIWESYQAKYESFPKVLKLREQQERENAQRAKCEQKKEMLDKIRNQLEDIKKERYSGYGDRNTFIIKLAEIYVSYMRSLEEIEMKKKVIERRRKMREMAEAEGNEAIQQIKEMHVDDRGQGQDEMESENQKPQNPPVEDVASPMISVFTGRSDTEEEMQMGELQAGPMEPMNSSEDPAVNVDQEHQKPQSWLASYQEQNQKETVQREAPARHEQRHQTQDIQKQPHQTPQPPFVAFQNAGHVQGSGDMEASVSIHLEREPAVKVDSQQHRNSPSTDPKPRAMESHQSNQSSYQQSFTSFTNPAFQTVPASPKFILPSVPLRPSAPRPSPRLLQNSPAVPQMTANRVIAPSISRCPPPGKGTVPSIQSPQIQQRSTIPRPPNAQPRPQRLTMPSPRPIQPRMPVPTLSASSNQQQCVSKASAQKMFTRPSLSAMRPAPQGSIQANSVIQKSARPSPQLSHPTFSAPNIQASSNIRHRLAPSHGAGLTSDLRAKQSSIPVPSPQVAMETEKRGPVYGGGEKQNDKLSPLMTPQLPQSQLPCSSPATSPMPQSPMQTSPISISSPGSTFQSSDGMTGSPFNMEKHREKLKSINKSPGHPLFTSDRRMFDGSKIDNNKNQEQNGASKIPEGASRFMMYGGGDGIGFSPFGEKRTEANTVDKTSSPVFGGGDPVSKASQSLFDGGEQISKTSQSLFGGGEQIGKTSQSLFGGGEQIGKGLATEEEPMKMSFYGSSFTPSSESGDFNSGQGQKSFDSIFGSSFDFGSKADMKSSSGDAGGTETSDNFASLFGDSGSNDDNSSSGFSFSFGAFDAASPSTEKFSMF